MPRGFKVNLTFITLASLFFVVLQIGVYCINLNEKEENCVNELNLNRSIIEAWNIEPILPEDNQEVGKYLACYWIKLGYLEEDGEFNYLKISEVVHDDLKSRFRSDCLHIAVYIVDSCRTSVQADWAGLKAIRMWNCLNVYSENLF